MYISHLDLQRVMARALRRSGLPVWYSQGFNPHIYMSFALPLPLGHQSLAETVDCKTESEETDFSAYVKPLSDALPRGIEVYKIAEPVYAAGDIATAEYRIAYVGQGEAALRKAADEYVAAPQAMVTRKTKRSEQQVNLKEVLPKLEVCADENGAMVLKALLPAGGEFNLNPDLLCGFLQQLGLPQEEAEVQRVAVFTADGKTFE